MAGARSYMLLCPITRALDRIGDRWTLLILRDLHAGPARFSELQAGLKGIASNLLTSRLQQLQADGLVQQRLAEFGVSVYELSDKGAHTNNILFELALFGGQFPANEELKRPGNLRLVAVTLRTACERVVDPAMDFDASLIIDGEDFSLSAHNGAVALLYRKVNNPDIQLITDYESMMAAAEGRLPLDLFLSDHSELKIYKDQCEKEFLTLMVGAMSVLSKPLTN